MATSGSYDFNVTAQEIIEGSLRILGVVDAGTTPGTAEPNDGMEALNLLVHQWAHNPTFVNRGFQAWHQLEQTLDISALTAKQSYALAPSGGDQVMQIPMDIVAVTKITSAGSRTLVNRVSLNQFLEWSNRTTTGAPSEWFYQKGLTSGVLWFNTIPADTTEDFVLTYVRPLQDIDALSNDVEFPKEWFRALKFHLALDLSLEFGIKASDLLIRLAAQSLELSNATDTQDSSMFLQPEFY